MSSQDNAFNGLSMAGLRGSSGGITQGSYLQQAVQPAPSYKPMFQTGIQVLGPWGPQDINPAYCLTQPSAVELASILGAKVVLDMPFGHWPGGGGFSQLSLVPWLEFPSPDPDTLPVRINAGQLAWVFVRYPYDFALANVRGQVALAQRGM